MKRKLALIIAVTTSLGASGVALGQPVIITEHGKPANFRGATSDKTEIEKAFTTTSAPDVYFPPSTEGYHLSKAFPSDTLGTYHLNGNIFSGPGIGAPENGRGTFNATYTNPWNVTSNLKYVFDPAALPQKDHVTTQAVSLECRPNRPNLHNPNPNRNWVACIYRGMDSGTGGGKNTSISSEIDNDVLNLSTNSATDMEVDVNFNGKVLDGKWSRGLFLTGGGAPGNQTNSVALDIMHVAYDHSWLPWTTGISIRNATNMIQLYKTQPTETGFFLETFDQQHTETSHLDKNGYLDIQGLRLIATSSPKPATECKKGQVTWDDDNLYLCTSAGKYKKVALQAL